MIRLRAPAKINLSLEVTGKRRDGFHELVSVMQTVTLFDFLELRPAPNIQVTCSDESIARNNLVEQGARMLMRAGNGCRIVLDKKIPIGAGLGGGSSDAAATLAGLTRLWSLDLGCDELRSHAEQLGSDVPYFLYGGTCLVEGRGERVAKLADANSYWLLLVNPGIRVSTAEIFAAVRTDDWSDGTVTRQVAREILRTGKSSLGRNGLQNALFRRFPTVRQCLDDVLAYAPDGALVSGSGPTVFAPFKDQEQAVEAAVALKRLAYWTAVAEAFAPTPGDSPCA